LEDNGIMVILSNDSSELLQLDEQQLSSAERRLRHKIWCRILSLISCLLQTLGDIGTLVEKTLDFVDIHQDRLVASLDIVHQSSVEALEEIEQITGFLYQLSFFAQKWKFRGVHSKILFAAVMLVPYFVYQPSHASKLFPDDKNKVAEPQKNDTSLVDYNILRNALAFVRRLALGGLMETWTPLFSPYLDMKLDQQGVPSIGTLISCQAICMATLRKMTLSEDPKTKKLQGIVLFIIENAVCITVAHVRLFQNSIQQQQIREEIANEVVVFIERLIRDLERLPKKQDLVPSITFLAHAQSIVKGLIRGYH